MSTGPKVIVKETFKRGSVRGLSKGQFLFDNVFLFILYVLVFRVWAESKRCECSPSDVLKQLFDLGCDRKMFIIGRVICTVSHTHHYFKIK